MADPQNFSSVAGILLLSPAISCLSFPHVDFVLRQVCPDISKDGPWHLWLMWSLVPRNRVTSDVIK